MIKFYNKFYNKKYTYTLHLNAIKLALKNAKFVIHTFQEGHPLREGNFSGLNISQLTSKRRFKEEITINQCQTDNFTNETIMLFNSNSFVHSCANYAAEMYTASQ